MFRFFLTVVPSSVLPDWLLSSSDAMDDLEEGRLLAVLVETLLGVDERDLDTIGRPIGLGGTLGFSWDFLELEAVTSGTNTGLDDLPGRLSSCGPLL